MPMITACPQAEGRGRMNGAKRGSRGRFVAFGIGPCWIVAAGLDRSAAHAVENAARLRAAPAHSPYRSGGGSPPFSDVPPSRSSIGVGPMGAFITL